MGFLSNWWQGSSAGDAADAGADHIRRKTSMDKKPDVWRSVFNPGSNPNVKNVGSSYYDTVKDKTKEPTTWDMILQSETRRKSFSDLDTNKDGFIERSDLQTAVGKSLPALDVEKIFAEADTNRDGKIDRKEFAAVLDRYFNDRHT